MTQPQQQPFDLATAMADDFAAQIAEKSRELAIAHARMAEMSRFIADHAEELNMEVQPNGVLAPKSVEPIDPTSAGASDVSPAASESAG